MNPEKWSTIKSQPTLIICEDKALSKTRFCANDINKIIKAQNATVQPLIKEIEKLKGQMKRLEINYIGACFFISRVSEKLITIPLSEPQLNHESLMLAKNVMDDLVKLLPERFEVVKISTGHALQIKEESK